MNISLPFTSTNRQNIIHLRGQQELAIFSTVDGAAEKRASERTAPSISQPHNPSAACWLTTGRHGRRLEALLSRPRPGAHDRPSLVLPSSLGSAYTASQRIAREPFNRSGRKESGEHSLYIRPLCFPPRVLRACVHACLSSWPHPAPEAKPQPQRRHSSLTARVGFASYHIPSRGVRQKQGQAGVCKLLRGTNRGGKRALLTTCMAEVAQTGGSDLDQARKGGQSPTRVGGWKRNDSLCAVQHEEVMAFAELQDYMADVFVASVGGGGIAGCGLVPAKSWGRGRLKRASR